MLIFIFRWSILLNFQVIFAVVNEKVDLQRQGSSILLFSSKYLLNICLFCFFIKAAIGAHNLDFQLNISHLVAIMLKIMLDKADIHDFIKMSFISISFLKTAILSIKRGIYSWFSAKYRVFSPILPRFRRFQGFFIILCKSVIFPIFQDFKLFSLKYAAIRKNRPTSRSGNIFIDQAEICSMMPKNTSRWCAAQQRWYRRIQAHMMHN